MFISLASPYTCIFYLPLRYSTAKNYDAAILLTKDSTLALLNKGEGNLAAQVGEQLISTLEKAQTPLSSSVEETLSTIFRGFVVNKDLIRQKMISASIGTGMVDATSVSPSSLSSADIKLEDPAVRFMKAALTWSAKASRSSTTQTSTSPVPASPSVKSKKPRAIPSAVLSRLFAHYLASKGDFAQANLHYLRSNAPAAHAAMLIRWTMTGDESEADLFLTRAVLQTLGTSEVGSIEGQSDDENQNSTMSNSALSARALELIRVFSLRFKHDALFQSKPLVHFCTLLCEAVAWGKVELFNVLKTKYEFALSSRDESLAKLVAKVGARCFGVAAPKGFLDSLLGSDE